VNISQLNIAIKKTDLWTLINESVHMQDVNDIRLEDQTYRVLNVELCNSRSTKHSCKTTLRNLSSI